MRAGTMVPSSASKRRISGLIQGKDFHSSVGESVTWLISAASSESATKSSRGRSATSCTIARRLPSGDSVPLKRPSPSVIRSRWEPSKSIQKRCSLNGEPSFVRRKNLERSSGMLTESTSHSPLVRARRSEPSAFTE